jgi:hypothetical protein
MALEIKVECYSGFKADERPLRFVTPPPAGRAYEVREVADQWYGVGYQCFKVRADDGNFYILRHHQEEDLWTLDSFRKGEEQEPEDRSQKPE